MIQNENPEKRKEAANQLHINFANLTDKENAWQDIHHLIKDKNNNVRKSAVTALGSAFPYILNKEQAWEDLHKLTMDNNRKVRKEAITVLGTKFPFIPEKKKAIEDVYRLTYDKDRKVQGRAVNALNHVFPQISDKKQAWAILHKLTLEKDKLIRRRAVTALGHNFFHIIDKEQAYEDLHRLINDKNSSVRKKAVIALGSALSYMPNNKQVWTDLYKLIRDKDANVRKEVAIVLGAVFLLVPDRKYAFNNLHKLTEDQNIVVQRKAIIAICANYPFIFNKNKAWEDIVQWIMNEKRDYITESNKVWEVVNQLTQGEYVKVRRKAPNSLISAFPHINDKRQIWEDIIQFIFDEDIHVRRGGADLLKNVFPHVDNKLAWKELHELIHKDDPIIIIRAISIIGAFFSLIPNKKEAYDDLILLTKHKYSIVRSSANYALGKVAIFEAVNAESIDDFKTEFENSLVFFEKSLKEEIPFNLTKFCLPFYQSFYAITFKKHNIKDEVEKYLLEAKTSVGDSKSKEKLLDIIKNLADALAEIQNSQETNLKEIKYDLNAYRRYCDRAMDLLASTEDRVPGATRLIRRGLPIIDKRIKAIVKEIQENAETLCKQTKGTPLEKLGKEVNGIGQDFSRIRDPIGLEKQVNIMEITLSKICDKMLEDEKEEACELLKIAEKELFVEDKLPLINNILSKVSSHMTIVKLEKKLDQIIISLKPGIREDLLITVGVEQSGTGVQHIITIPLQEISYFELKEDLEKIKGKTIDKLKSLPEKLASKIKDYLIRNKKNELLEILS